MSNGDTLQQVAKSVAVIEADVKSLTKTLDTNLESIRDCYDKIERKLDDHDRRIYQNAKDISRVTTWMTIVGTIIGIAVALSYLIP